MFLKKVNPDLLAVVCSVIVQLPLAAFLGHYYDQRILLQDGYLISSGLNPYVPNTISVFSNQYLTGLNPIIGYPPLWPLLMGLIYRLTYNIVPNLFFYNLATKTPIIASNILLAYVTKRVLQRQNVSASGVRFAWFFLLFNPLILLTSTAWGQFDTLIALLCVSALYLLSKGMVVRSTLALSLGIVLKPIALPLLVLPLVASTAERREKILSILVLLVVVLALWFLPFNLLGWAMPNVGDTIAFVKMYGGLTIYSFYWLTSGQLVVSTAMGFISYLWIPLVLTISLMVYRKKPKTLPQLTKAAVLLLLTFFLTKTWLSEQNLNVLLPMLVMLFCFGILNGKRLHLSWILPLAFMFINYAAFLLLFLAYPPIIPLLAAFDAQFSFWRLLARFLVAALWFLLGLNIAAQLLLKPGKKSFNATFRLRSEKYQTPTFGAILSNPDHKTANSANMQPLTVALTGRLSVKLYRDRGPNFWETGKLHKGLVMLLDGKELVEEGVGFGVPVAKYADKTFFPGAAEVSVKANGALCKVYTLDTVSVKRWGKTIYINDRAYSSLRKTFALLYLKHKRLNRVFNKIMELRDLANIKTDFVNVKPRGKVTVTYECQPTGIRILADFTELTTETCKELLILNEQGASVFQVYEDINGKIAGNHIGAWEEVSANQAWLLSPRGWLSFGLEKHGGAKFFRGWEYTRNRFSWAGLSYLLVPHKRIFEYFISVDYNEPS